MIIILLNRVHTSFTFYIFNLHNHNIIYNLTPRTFYVQTVSCGVRKVLPGSLASTFEYIRYNIEFYGTRVALPSSCIGSHRAIAP